MAIRIDPAKCTACALCEEACSYYHDEAFSLLSSSIMLYRSEEKKNYLGLILKLEDSLVLAKAEGVEQAKIGELASKGGEAALPPSPSSSARLATVAWAWRRPGACASAHRRPRAGGG